MVDLGERLVPTAAVCVTASPDGDRLFPVSPTPSACALLCSVQLPGWVVNHCRRGGGSSLLVHKADAADPLLIPFSIFSTGTCGCPSTRTTTAFSCGS